jgi:hypothetical protein
MRIYVGGSLHNVPVNGELCRSFAAALGVEIVRRGHYLLNGCRSAFDEEIAKAAHSWLLANDAPNAEERIISYCLKGDRPIHNLGRVSSSALPDWQMTHPKLLVPEQIERAAAAIFVAGSEGTYWARNWAFYARRPILGVPRFGGAGEEIYQQELERLLTRSPLMGNDFETLNHLFSDVASYATRVVDLTKRLVIPPIVFSIMSFDKAYLPIYRVFEQVCKDFGFKTERTDQSVSTERIIPRIENGIRNSPFVLADVSDESVNVLYEVGFAKALGKDVILTARKGTTLPFDAYDIQTVFWEKPADLRTELRRVIRGLLAKFDI